MNYGAVTRMKAIIQGANGMHTPFSKATKFHCLRSHSADFSLRRRSARTLHSKKIESQKFVASDNRKSFNVASTATFQRTGAVKIPAPNLPKSENEIIFKPKWDIHRRHLETFGKIRELQRRLGLAGGEISLQSPTVFISIDTETERLGLLNYVSEVGICILDARDLEGVPPGSNARDWHTKMQTMHWRINHNNVVIKKHIRGDQCLFAKSKNLTPKQVQDALLRCLHSVKSTGKGPVDLVLVGHTIDRDIQVLKGRPLFLNLRRFVNFAQIFDTVALAAAAEEQGAKFHSKSLGSLLPRLGVDSKYCRLVDGLTILRGWHNSGNDAAYTMMLLLQFATRWHELSKDNLKTCKSDISA